ncbi:MAG: ribosome silencing factor [Holosporales bacterium]|jgi:ribosome-associated protein|nr:ribosome silencing factor [Holosporales bacterium]
MNRLKNDDYREIKGELLQLLFDKKLDDILEIDLLNRGSGFSDVCIIGSGTSSRHAQSIADYVYRFFKSRRLNPIMEGSGKTGWIMIESHGIEIHLFKPEVRQYYDLELLFGITRKSENESECSSIGA